MKRGDSGLSLVVAVNKPAGMTSHDVVNRCRRIFGERRVGHAGTLDPLATGVLIVCVGPATRLVNYLTAHDKRYRTTIGFGFETDTDDREGIPTVTGVVGEDMLEGSFAEAYVSGLVGEHLQVPPRYSAIKKDGKKAYELARTGTEVSLEPRRIEVYESSLVNRFKDSKGVHWVVDFSVSKGTYIRALARDMGRELGCYGHVEALERLKSGEVGLDECVTLETLEMLGEQAALDPVRVLGLRILFADHAQSLVDNGGPIDEHNTVLYELASGATDMQHCACTGTIAESVGEPRDGELVSVVVFNRLKGIYRYDASNRIFKADCVFATGVFRG